ncbi:MAG: ROK family protein [Candidatus Saccharimonadales bacterium]
MYVGVDIGGTKTLVAVLDDHGVITEKIKFPTPQKYKVFLEQLATTTKKFSEHNFRAGGVAIPGRVDHKHGRGIRFGNLPWKDVSIQSDTEKILNCPIVIENDAKCGGLSEAMLLKNEYSKVLYVAVGTGIGIALVVDGMIDSFMGDSGGRSILLEQHGKATSWESFASGHAIVERFGKKASDITDENTWKIVAHDLARGCIELIAITEPEVIVIGGSIGTYFKRYGMFLAAEIEKYHVPLVPLPVIVEAQRPEEAVVYGCYDLAKQIDGHGKTDR